MAASKAGQYRGPTPSDFLKCPANAQVAASGNESLLQRFHRVAMTPRSAVHLGQIQIELRMIALYLQRFAAQLLASDVTFFNHSAEHARIREKERILRLRLKSAAIVSECYTSVLIIKVSETLCKFSTPYTSRRMRSHLVQHVAVPLRRVFELSLETNASE